MPQPLELAVQGMEIDRGVGCEMRPQIGEQLEDGTASRGGAGRAGHEVFGTCTTEATRLALVCPWLPCNACGDLARRSPEAAKKELTRARRGRAPTPWRDTTRDLPPPEA